MRKITLFLVAMMMSLTTMGQKQLYILHTNDTHSTIYPLNPNLKDKKLAARGGFLRRIAMVQEERKAHPDLLFFDSGDFSQGSVYYTMFKGDVEINLMNEMGYDAACIGNHEFDFGIDNMARLFRMARFPILCANYDFRGTVLEGLVKPYIVIKRNGMRIGVFGLSPKLEGLVEMANCPGIVWKDPVSVANEMVNVLKQKEKCDLVICLSHIGWDSNNGPNDQQVVAGTSGIDLVLNLAQGLMDSLPTLLEQVPHRRVLDLAMVFYSMIHIDGVGDGAVLIHGGKGENVPIGRFPLLRRRFRRGRAI